MLSLFVKINFELLFFYQMELNIFIALHSPKLFQSKHLFLIMIYFQYYFILPVLLQ